jgi:voltage-gated potassium channel Kch
MPALKSEDAEYRRITRSFRAAAIVSFVTILGGSIFYHLVEDLSWIDSVYLSVITLATVGYGDITPHTNAGKIFTIFYVLFGIGIIAALANLMLRRAAIRRRPK